MEGGKWLMLAGMLILLAGAVLYYAPTSWISVFRRLGHLPGDIAIEKENFRFYFPITTMVLLSVILHLVLRLLKYLKLF